MKVTILGCGGAGGVPTVSGGWGACDPGEPRNRRRRPSILVEEGPVAILVDTSPDLREQLLDAGARRLDAVLYTHAHADHLHGIDDLREVNRAMQAPLPVHAAPEVLKTIGERFAYVFEPLKVPFYYKPVLEPRPISGPFAVAGVEVTPFVQDHGWSASLGFLFGGRVAYSTDAVNLPDEAFDLVRGVDLWIVGALVETPHDTHAHLAKAVDWIERAGAKRGVITHMGPRLDYRAVKAKLPPHVEPAYDGLVIEV